MKVIDVVCGVVFNKEGKVLICQRKDLNLKWEFPGGKIKKNETVNLSIIRELYEELTIEIEPVEILFKNLYKSYNLIFVKCNFLRGEIILNDHINFMWVNHYELVNYDFLDGDKEFVKHLTSNETNK